MYCMGAPWGRPVRPGVTRRKVQLGIIAGRLPPPAPTRSARWPAGAVKPRAGWPRRRPGATLRSSSCLLRIEVRMFPRDCKIAGYDDELAAAIAAEGQRQEDHVELIASENYASPRVMEAQGSKLTNKYAEGYPGKR